MKNKQIFITLEQFKVLAARINAKEQFIRDKVESWRKLAESYAENYGDGYDWSLARFVDLIDLLARPADSFFAFCEADMQQPEKHQPTQLELFGKEFC